MTSHLMHHASSSTSPSWVQQHQPCWRRTGTVASRAAFLCQPAGTAMGSLHVWTFWSVWDQTPGRKEGHSFFNEFKFSKCRTAYTNENGCISQFGIIISFSKRHSLLIWIHEQYYIQSTNRFKCSNTSRSIIFPPWCKCTTGFELAAGSGLLQ